jgi:hypothetical protein
MNQYITVICTKNKLKLINKTKVKKKLKTSLIFIRLNKERDHTISLNLKNNLI